MLSLVWVRLVAWLNDLSATVQLAGVAALVALLLTIGRAHSLPFAFDGLHDA